MSKPNEVQLKLIRRVVNIITAAALTLSSFRQGTTRLLNCQLAAGQAFTLPAANGKKGKFRFFVGITYTGNATIHTAGSDLIAGVSDVSGSTNGFFATASNTNTITMNGTTTGGVKGSYVELEDVGLALWRVNGRLIGSGTAATPFSNS